MKGDYIMLVTFKSGLQITASRSELDAVGTGDSEAVTVKIKGKQII